SSPLRTLARFLTQYWAKNQVREGNTHPTAITAISWWSTHYLPSCGHPLSQVDGAAAPNLYLEPDTHFLMCMMPLHRRELSPGFLTQYWAENQTTNFSCG
ncbi:hypothetical protein M405DRAFT_809464, partial [Rhizopogon salebrosus TDB-379]